MNQKRLSANRVVALFFILAAWTMIFSVCAMAAGTLRVGDTDGNGRITSADATVLARYLAGHFANNPGHISHTPEWQRIADTNCDGVIDVDDLTRLARALVGHFSRLCPYGGCRRCDPANHGHRFPGGDGTEGNPFWVSTPEDLNAVRYHLAAHFIQINDIDMAFDTTSPGGLFFNGGAGWEPIGTFESDINWFDDVFTGVYDGGGYVIKGLNIDRASSRQQLLVGLFSYVYGGEVRNLGMVEGSVRGTSTGGPDSQVIVGSISGVLVGSKLTNSFSTGTVLAENEPNIGSLAFAGGLIGHAQNSIISDSHNTGNIYAITGLGSFASVGGISGQTISDSHISNSSNKGVVYSSNPARVSYAGGITGYMGLGSISNCRNYGYIEAFTAVGGIVGLTNTMNITNSYNAGKVTGGLLHNVGSIYGRFRE